MDPSWTECPFCQTSHEADIKIPALEKEISQRRKVAPQHKTMIEDPHNIPDALPHAPAVLDAPVDQYKTKPDPPSPPVHSAAILDAPIDPFKTRVVAPERVVPKLSEPKKPQASGPSPGAQTKLNPILGVLVSYSFNKNGSAYLIRMGRNIIGSSPGADVRAQDPSVSEKHAIFYAKPGTFVIDDCLSTNGTFINGKEVTEKVRIKSGDVIQTGETLWRFLAFMPPKPSMKVSRKGTL